MKLATIEIDFDIHQAIEAERRSFDEPPYLALRRLLKLPEVRPENDARPAIGKPWREGNVEIPHGSLAKMSYQRNSQMYEGAFLDGYLVVNGQRFSTLSSAASALALTKDGQHPALNGWLYWHVQFPGDTKWIPMEVLRTSKRKKAQF